MIDPYELGIAKATAPIKVVTYTWDGEEVMTGDDVLVLHETGDVLFADVDKMRDYIRHRIIQLGGLDRWVADDLGEGHSGSELIITMLSDPLTLDDIFDNYYGAERSEAGKNL